MSMPSSSCEVATTAGSRPALRSSSTSARCSLRHRAVVGAGDDDVAARLRRTRTGPSAAAGGGPSSGSSRPRVRMPARSAGRSAARRAGGSWRTRSWSGGPGRGRACAPRRAARSTRGAPRRRPARSRSSVGSPIADMSSTGHDDLRVDRLARTAAGRPRPAARRRGSVATSSTGRTVADSPMRCAGVVEQLVQAFQREGEVGAALGRRTPRAPRRRSRCRSPRSASRAAEVSIRNSDSGVVIRMSGGPAGELPALVGGSVAGAHADRDVGHAAARAAPRPAGCRPAGCAGCARRRRPAP